MVTAALNYLPQVITVEIDRNSPPLKFYFSLKKKKGGLFLTSAFEFQSQIPCCHEVQLDLFQEKEKIKMSVLSSVRLSVNRNW